VGWEWPSLEDIVGLASLSAKAVVLAFFFLCRKRRSMKIPIRATAATPPTTTPAMRPVDGPELEGEVEAAAAADDEFGSCEVKLDAPLLVGEASEDVGPLVPAVLLGVLDASSVSTAEVTAAAILVGFAGVGSESNTLLATDSIIAVGTVTSLFDRTEDTSPTILDKRSPICLR
jgi:hypothetical protein